MNLEIANRLVELRKQHGYSQEDLADKLGVSRQAVSKWERVEASPDTDNLIALAKLYGVSVDELLNYKPSAAAGKEAAAETAENSSDAEETKDDSEKTDDDMSAEEFDRKYRTKHGIHIKDKDGTVVHIGLDGIHVKDEGDELHVGFSGIHAKENKSGKEESRDFSPKEFFVKKRNHPVWAIVNATSVLLIVAAYLLLGFLMDAWHPAWLLFLLIPTLTANNLSDLTGTFPILVVGGYLCLGFFLDAWHPGWLIFLSIPVFYIAVDQIKKAVRANRKIKITKITDENGVVIDGDHIEIK